MHRHLAFERFERLIIALCCLTTMVMVSEEAVGAPKDPPNLNIGYAFEENSLERRGLDVFVSALLEARIASLQPIPARKFGDSERALLDAVRKDKVDLAIVHFDVLAKEKASFGVFTTPFLFEDFRHLSAVQRGSVGQELLRGLRQLGVRGIGWWAGDFLAIAGERSAVDPSDLVRRPIAFQPKSIDGLPKATAVPELSRAVGALPVPLPATPFEAPVSWATAEVIEATQQQLRQTVEAPKFITLTNHLNAGYVVVASPASWDKLDIQTQNALVDAFDRAHHIATDGLQLQQDRLFEGAPGNAAVMPLTAADRLRWRERMRMPDREGRIASLIEQVRTYPVARLVSGEAPEARISWNTWLEDSRGNDAVALMVGKVSRINLDLGRLPYQRMLTNAADPRLAAALSNGEPLRLFVQPVLLGSQIEAAPGQPFNAALMTIGLKNAKTLETDEEKRQAHWDGALSTRDLAATLGLGNVLQWSVKASQEGCADVAFVIWDEARIEPLDHVVVSFPIQKQGGPTVTCYGKNGSKEMSAGLETLLRLPRTGQTQADASLHVFEYADYGSTRSVAVFVHAARLAAARNDPAADLGVYSWELVSPLSAYASDPNQLPQLITEAHQRLSKEMPYPYEDVASDLAKVLFAGKTERDVQQAQQAAEAFKDAIAHGAPGRVLMRLVNEGGKAMYLPLGLLAASATKPFVTKRFSVIQSLPGGTAAPAACVRSWHVARSPTLQGAAGVTQKLLGEAPSQLPAPAQLMTTHSAVAQYLGSQPTSAEGEGFIMLAHHDAGSLRFSAADHAPPWIRSDYIYRRFPPGSLGLLAACSTSGTSQQTSAIVNRLASQGMSSIVLSPFPVDIEYGVRLALAFERQVLEEARSPTGATAATLFERSTADVAASLPIGAGLQDMALEFQLVGDPDMKICAPQRGD